MDKAQVKVVAAKMSVIKSTEEVTPEAIQYDWWLKEDEINYSYRD